MESRVVVPAIGLVLILMVSFPMNLNSPMQEDQNKSPVIEQVDNTVTSYTPHATIQTSGDTDLYNLAIADDWPGYGNMTHPWIIEGYSITDLRPIEIGFTSYIFTIRNCLITGTDPNSYYAIRILGTDYTRVENCIVSGSEEGIEFYDVQYGTIRNCTVYDCNTFGVYFQYSEHCNIYDSEVYSHTRVGIGVKGSEDTDLVNNTIYGNGHQGILTSDELGWYSDYLTLHNNTIHSNGDSSRPGIHIIEADYVTATSMHIHDNYDGIRIQDSHGFSISDSHIYDNLRSGVVGSQSSSITIATSHIENNAFKGAELTGITLCTITDNDVFENDQSGIVIGSSSDCHITHNTIYGNLDFGLHVDSTDSGTFENNTIRNNGNTGFYLGHAEDWTVYDNLVYENAGHGFGLFEVNNSLLYHNDIGWNGLSNANDTGSGTNYWNTTDTGNWWHDYTGGVYDISGGATDHFPSHSLSVESSGPLNVQWESAGDQINWYTDALHPTSYLAYQNGSLIGSGEWDGSNVYVDVNTSTLGFYECTIVAFHISGHNTTQTTSVTIGDWLGPNWGFTPQDVILLYGTDLFYNLVAIDPSGIGSWGVNDTVNFAISESGLITNNVALDIGEYGLNISVYDTLGNVRHIAIRIIIIDEIPVTTTTPIPTTTPTTPPTTTPAGDSTLLIMSGLLGAFGGAFLVTVIVLISKKRGGKPG
ncbi:MAG: right-handed parallel beta-helix repeat-containing protein [Candidatus Thorarchaeota archaeon]|jgi:parallel beta-helix repeat protein